MQMKLYGYFRSSAAYRVRIALNVKQLGYESVPVHLIRDGGQQLAQTYRELNPTALVPTFIDQNVSIGQSIAIMEYLEEAYPQVPILPATQAGRARVRSLAQFIACDIHPLNNLRVLKYLKRELGVTDEVKNEWYLHWIRQGFDSLEKMLASSIDTGVYCHGDTPTIADFCLVPQVANAQRFDCDLSAMPNVMRIDAACRELPAFADAAPGKQPDAE